MRLWQIIEEIHKRKMMVRIAIFPSGTVNIGIYENLKQSKQHLYDADSWGEMEVKIEKDFGHLLHTIRPASEIKPIPKIPPMPRMLQ